MIAEAVAEAPLPVPHLTPDAEAGAEASRKSDSACAPAERARAERASAGAEPDIFIVHTLPTSSRVSRVEIPLKNYYERASY